MTDYIIDGTILENIAAAIRTGTGSTELIVPEKMADEIATVCEESVKQTHYAFLGKTLKEVFFPDGLKTIEDYIYQDQANLSGEIILPKSVTAIGARSFDGCKEITKVQGEGVTSIGSYCFYRAAAMVEFDCPKLKTAGTYAFQNCESLTTLTFPALTTLPGNLFMLCYKLSKVDFHVLTNIDAQGFRNASALETVIIRTPSVCTVDNANAFSACQNITNGTCKFYVPDELVSNYKAATHWSSYANQILPISELEGDI